MLTEPRWTHVALPTGDVDAAVAFYTDYTPLIEVHRHADAAGATVWLSNEGQVSAPFVLVLVSFAANKGTAQPVLAPFAHLGIEVPDRAAVDEVAARGRRAGCLRWEPQQLPDPVGYVCALSDPDGNVVEFSFDQKVYESVRGRWGDPGDDHSFAAGPVPALVPGASSSPGAMGPAPGTAGRPVGGPAGGLDRVAFAGWLAACLSALVDPSPAVLDRLFTADAVYRTGGVTYRGPAAIAELWRSRTAAVDSPSGPRLSGEPVALDGPIAAARITSGAEAAGGPGAIAVVLWIVRMAVDGRCAEVEEWSA